MGREAFQAEGSVSRDLVVRVRRWAGAGRACGGGCAALGEAGADQAPAFPAGAALDCGGGEGEGPWSSWKGFMGSLKCEMLSAF